MPPSVAACPHLKSSRHGICTHALRSPPPTARFARALHTQHRIEATVINDANVKKYTQAVKQNEALRAEQASINSLNEKLENDYSRDMVCVCASLLSYAKHSLGVRIGAGTHRRWEGRGESEREGGGGAC